MGEGPHIEDMNIFSFEYLKTEIVSKSCGGKTFYFDIRSGPKWWNLEAIEHQIFTMITRVYINTLHIKYNCGVVLSYFFCI